MLTSSEMLRYVEVSDERGASFCKDKHSVELLDPEEGYVETPTRRPRRLECSSTPL